MKIEWHYKSFLHWRHIARKVLSAPELQDYLFLGIDERGMLRFVHRSVVYANCHIVGKTRTGKSSLVALALALQELARGKTRIIVLDPKGDEAQFHTFRIACKLLGREFKYFTVESDRASYGYFLLKQAFWQSRSITEKVQLLMMIAGLNYGDREPGLAYFSLQSERVFQGALRLCPHATSYRELYDVTQRPNAHKLFGMSKRDFENGGAAISNLARLADLPQLTGGTPEQEAAAIDIAKCVPARSSNSPWARAASRERT